MRRSPLASLALHVIAAIVLAAGLWLVHLLMLAYVAEGGGVPIAASVAALFALGAMRKPWFFLAVAVLLRLALPTVSDLGNHDFFVACFTLALPLGAIAGVILRAIRKRHSARVDSRPTDAAVLADPITPPPHD